MLLSNLPEHKSFVPLQVHTYLTSFLGPLYPGRLVRTSLILEAGVFPKALAATLKAIIHSILRAISRQGGLKL